MTWLAPLGFLAFISIAILILIYIIKPNYQQKFISSTFVWRLSLKYKKKKLPISKLRNILLFICQIAALTACSLLIAQPIIRAEKVEIVEKIAIIDASGNMYAQVYNETRFERAVDQVKLLTNEVLSSEGIISIIVANEEPYFIAERDSGVEKVSEINAKLDEMLVPNAVACSYGNNDMERAMKMAEDLLVLNPEAEVVLYTGTEYIDEGIVIVEDVSDSLEWNAAILNASTRTIENIHVFDIDVACYGKDVDLLVTVDIFGVNFTNEVKTYTYDARCANDETLSFTISTASETGENGVFAFNYAHIFITEADSYTIDNEFFIYGGIKPSIKIQYCSPLVNPFVSGMCMAIRNEMKNVWDIQYDQVRSLEDAYMEGYDLYIFEHEMPETIPVDGAVFLIHPDKAPRNAGIMIDNKESTGQWTLAPAEDHVITQHLPLEEIMITSYRRITANDGYTTLLNCGGDPVFLIKNVGAEKIAVLAINFHNSTLGVQPEWAGSFYQLFNHYMPQTLTGYVFDVNSSININSRSNQLMVYGPSIDGELQITQFPGTISLSKPGTYTFTQNLLTGETATETVFVKVPAEQSHINKTVDELVNPYVEKITEITDEDLYFWFAVALVALVFIEWLLHIKEN